MMIKQMQRLSIWQQKDQRQGHKDGKGTERGTLEEEKGNYPLIPQSQRCRAELKLQECRVNYVKCKGHATIAVNKK